MAISEDTAVTSLSPLLAAVKATAGGLFFLHSVSILSAKVGAYPLLDFPMSSACSNNSEISKNQARNEATLSCCCFKTPAHFSQSSSTFEGSCESSISATVLALSRMNLLRPFCIPSGRIEKAAAVWTRT
jgi:hypothetical protein